MGYSRAARTTQRKGRTPKKSKGKVLDVRSDDHLEHFENLMVNGPLTLVFVRLEGCGPCERFKKDVWSPLSELKKKGMNMAMIESNMVPKTSLSSVPTKSYPTLLLVGKDKKPATFVDEDGQPTNSMPRKNTLEEDKETLTALIRSPNMHPLAENTTLSGPKIPNSSSVIPNVTPLTAAHMDEISQTSPTAKPNTPESREGEIEVSRTIQNVPLRNNISRKKMRSIPASPYGLDDDGEIPSIVKSKHSNKRKNETAKRVPNVASDLLASQSGSRSGSAAVLSRETERLQAPRQLGGKLLNAIREHTKSLDTVLKMRNRTVSRKNHR
jgi:hypothetical protein